MLLKTGHIWMIACKVQIKVNICQVLFVIEKVFYFYFMAPNVGLFVHFHFHSLTLLLYVQRHSELFCLHNLVISSDNRIPLPILTCFLLLALGIVLVIPSLLVAVIIAISSIGLFLLLFQFWLFLLSESFLSWYWL